MREACRFILTEVLFHPMSLVYQVVIARSRECTVAEESPVAESCMAEPHHGRRAPLWRRAIRGALLH